MRGPKDQRVGVAEENKARGPEDQGSGSAGRKGQEKVGPEDKTTREPEDQKAAERRGQRATRQVRARQRRRRRRTGQRAKTERRRVKEMNRGTPPLRRCVGGNAGRTMHASACARAWDQRISVRRCGWDRFPQRRAPAFSIEGLRQVGVLDQYGGVLPSPYTRTEEVANEEGAGRKEGEEEREMNRGPPPLKRGVGGNAGRTMHASACARAWDQRISVRRCGWDRFPQRRAPAFSIEGLRQVGVLDQYGGVLPSPYTKTKTKTKTKNKKKKRRW